MWGNPAAQHVYELMNAIDDPLSKIMDGLVIDKSQFVGVDGEEGDYGIITYSLGLDYGPDAGKLIATHVIEGGDCEYYEYTDFGKDWINRAIIELIKNAEI